MIKRPRSSRTLIATALTILAIAFSIWTTLALSPSHVLAEGQLPGENKPTVP